MQRPRTAVIQRLTTAVIVGCSVLLATPFAAAVAQAGTLPPLIGYDDGNAGVYVAPMSAPSRGVLAAPAGLYPQFSPNGSQLAYDVERQNSSGQTTNSIVIASRTGAHPRDLITGPAAYDGDKNGVLFPLVWSPNGKEIAYGCDGQDDTPSGSPSEILSAWEQICVVNVATRSHHMITDPTTDTEPPIGVGLDERWSWAPDGRHILATVLEPGTCLTGYSFAFGCGYAAIGEIDVDSGAVTQLTNVSSPTTKALTPSVSPNGRQIMYTYETTSGASNELQIIGSGGTQTLDTGGPDLAAGAIFSLNGKDALFTKYPNIDSTYVQAFEIPISGGKPKQLTDVDRPVYDLTLAPALATCTVPNLMHKTLAAAKKLLKRAACTLGKVSGPKTHRDSRVIIRQSPKARREEPAGTRVNVTVA